MATLDVRFASVELRAPDGKAKLGAVRLWAVLARERRTPRSGKRLQWMLLTTVEVNSLAEARRALAWYEKRWHIEIFHRTFKSGCRIEHRQLADADSLEGCLAVDMVVAWRVHHLVWLNRDDPKQSCTNYFGDDEWRALYVAIHRRFPPNDTPLTMRDATRLVAQLGGFLARKRDGEPGAQALWIGLQRLDDIVTGYLATIDAFGSVRRHPP
jgi:hypothetical protein